MNDTKKIHRQNIESNNDNNDKIKQYDESKTPKKKKKKLNEEDTLKTNPTTTMTIQKNGNLCKKNTATHSKNNENKRRDQGNNEKENDTFIMNSTAPKRDDQVIIRNEHLHPTNQKVVDVKLYFKDNGDKYTYQQKLPSHEAMVDKNKNKIDDITPKKKSIDNATPDVSVIEDEGDHIVSVQNNYTNQNTQQTVKETSEEYEIDLQNTTVSENTTSQRMPKQDDTICFICGNRFVGGVKSKVNHIKRCSKQHGISIKDIKQDCDDEDYFLSHDETKMYDNNEKKDWHNPELSSNLSTQATLTNYFTKSQKSIHQVLMAGAKRMAKTSAILLQKHQNHVIPKRKKQWKRRRINNNSYTNVSTSEHNLYFFGETIFKMNHLIFCDEIPTKS